MKNIKHLIDYDSFNRINESESNYLEGQEGYSSNIPDERYIQTKLSDLGDNLKKCLALDNNLHQEKKLVIFNFNNPMKLDSVFKSFSVENNIGFMLLTANDTSKNLKVQYTNKIHSDKKNIILIHYSTWSSPEDIINFSLCKPPFDVQCGQNDILLVAFDINPDSYDEQDGYIENLSLQNDLDDNLCYIDVFE